MIKLTSILSEDLRKWFGKGPTGGWDRYNSKGEKVGKCGDSEEGSKYAACLSNEKAAKLGKDGRASFVKRKQTAQSKAGDAKKGGEQKKGQKPVFVKTGASENVNEAGMNPVKKVVNAILKKHNVQAMKTYASSVRGAHNIINGGYRWEGDWHLGFYGNVPQDVIEKVAAEMEKAGVKYVKVKKGHISADFSKTGLSEDWSQKYKNSIDCNNPKGFSQKAHCQGKKKSLTESDQEKLKDNGYDLDKIKKALKILTQVSDTVGEYIPLKFKLYGYHLKKFSGYSPALILYIDVDTEDGVYDTNSKNWHDISQQLLEIFQMLGIRDERYMRPMYDFKYNKRSLEGMIIV